MRRHAYWARPLAEGMMGRTKDQRNRKVAMSLTEQELARREDFERQYRDGQRPAVQAVERWRIGG